MRSLWYWASIAARCSLSQAWLKLALFGSSSHLGRSLRYGLSCLTISEPRSPSSRRCFLDFCKSLSCWLISGLRAWSKGTCIAQSSLKLTGDRCVFGKLRLVCSKRAKALRRITHTHERYSGYSLVRVMALDFDAGYRNSGLEFSYISPISRHSESYGMIKSLETEKT